MSIELTKSDNSDFLKFKPQPKTGAAKWVDIEDLINRWARRNPEGARLNEQWLIEARQGLSDSKYARMGGGEHKESGITNRFGLSLHPELLQYIEAFYPDVMDTKESMHEFMKRFPKFRVPEQS